MTSPTLGPGHTRADLDRMPDDGNRYELIEGEIVVSAAPSPRHQIVSARLFRMLDDACPAGLMALYAPLQVALEERSVVEPDLAVFDPQRLDDRGLTGPPLLAVEILSPSTRSRDQVRKMRLYERAGVTSYWIVDPEGEVSFTAWELDDGHFQPVAAIAGEEEWSASKPYDVSIVPASLVR